MVEFDLSSLIGAHPGERLVFSLDEGPLQLKDVHVEFLRGALQFTRIQEGILVEGQLESGVEAECGRCLEPLLLNVRLDVEEIISLYGRSRPDVTYSLTEEGRFDATPLLREQTLVTIPMKSLCQPECQGICPQCGINLNLEACECVREEINPQFAALASLLSEEDEEQE